MYKTLAVDAM